jgi:hypothetical protein
VPWWPAMHHGPGTYHRAMLSQLPRADNHGELTGVVPFDHQPSVALAIVPIGPASRLRALLEIVRPYVDEVVVAIHRDGDPGSFDACSDLADRRLTLDLPEATVQRARAWLHHQCTADWILSLDDDEVPGAALLKGLGALVADRRPAALCLETRWVYPDPRTYIVSPPWRGDMRPRIVRNLPGIWRFHGQGHGPLSVTGEVRYVDLPVYHLDLLLASEEECLRKAAVSDQRQPGPAVQGFRVRDLYRPDALGDLLETRAVGAEDHPLLDALVNPVVPASASGHGQPDGHGSRWAVDQFNQRTGALDAGDYRARVEALGPPTTVPVRGERRCVVRVRNDGSIRWPAGERQAPLVRLGYRWVEEASGEVTIDGRWLLSESVMPGETTIQLMSVQTPPRPGRHLLEIDVVHEHVRWFQCPVVLQVKVEGEDRAALRAASPVADDAAEVRLLECQLTEIDAELAAERQLRASLQGRLAEWLGAPLDKLRALRR